MYTIGKVTLILGIVVAISMGAMFLASMTFHKPAPVVILETHSPEFQAAFYDASRIYGKAGCGDQSLAEMTATVALENGIQARLVAAQVAIESSCNPLSISNRQAVGLMQVVPKVWTKQYDFTKVNLFNPRDNMEIGTQIMSGLVKQYGIKGALSRYYGTGADQIGLGGSGYAEKVYQMAGVK